MAVILHVDMDAFFASVEVGDHPEWKGKPLVVGSAPDKRGVVATASYEARAFGIHSAMPSRTAFRLCPHAIFAPVRMARYLDVSDQIMSVLRSFSPLVEQVSVDEAFLDITGMLRLWPTREKLALALKQAIRDSTGLTASVGLAPNKFLAKLASDLQKPDGLSLVPDAPDAILAFLAPMPVTRIWGVGKVTGGILRDAGFRTIGDLQQMSAATLAPMVGPALAEHITQLAKGIDDRPVLTDTKTKSISAETTFEEDVHDPGVVRETLIGLVEQVGQRLRKARLAAGAVHLKVRFEDFQTVTRQESMASPVCSDRRLLASGLNLFERQVLKQPIRLIGFGVSRLVAQDDVPSGLLFPDPQAEQEARDVRLDQALDRVREKLGPNAVFRGARIDRINNKRD